MALYLWDEFDYESSVRILRRLYEPAKVLSDDEHLSRLTALAIRLLEPGNRLCALLPVLRQARQGQVPVSSVAGHFPLLVADALENASRRLDERRATDSVLRSYRAVEVAVQSRVLQNGINPWRPDWQAVEEQTMQGYLDLLNATQPPKDLALSTGLTLLEALGQALSEEKKRGLDDLRQSRNHSYLEHGYQRLKVEDAWRLNGYAVSLCEDLLGSSLDAARASVRHS